LFSDSRDQTVEIGRRIGTSLTGGDIVALIGELGSGKTCLTQGMAKGLGVAENVPVVSPTFTLVNEYPGRVPLVHLDVYRLSGPRDLEDMGYEEYFYGGGVVVIEWAEKVREILPEKTIVIRMAFIDENTRELILEGPPEKLEEMEKRLKSGGSISWR
jgi:tRNA threonylcarbamoyladenosine biosynthesis protein TsaE